MPVPLDPAQEESPVRRQITQVNFNVVMDCNEVAAAIPTLTAAVWFTDLWRKPDSTPVVYPLPQPVVLTTEELMAVPANPS